MRLVLASQSPRRAELLRQAGYSFSVQPANTDEKRLSGESPVDHVTRLALEKASAIARYHPSDVLVLGADTIVVLGEDILGKPQNHTQAKEMLLRLSGREHEVLTGLAIIQAPATVRLSCVEKSTVQFASLTPEQIDTYIASGEPFDKAGAYGIQGLAGHFARLTQGLLNTVIGLPIEVLHPHLKDCVITHDL